MKPLDSWPPEARRAIVGVFIDIDDTLTTGGLVTGEVLQALAALKAAGLHVIPVTGRPVGWSETFALQWPVDAIVAENGAVALVRAPLPGGLRKLYQQDAQVRAANYIRMQRVAQRIVAEMPDATLSRDSAGRETDIAIDHSEYVQLPQACITHAVKLMEDEGMKASVSSIHINGWYGDHNKLSGARWIVRALFGRELDDEIDRWVYVGDSTNDVLMFEHFPHSVGVANIRRFEAQLTHLPRYIARSERGAGFAEIAKSLLESKSSR